jgi:hypothetical protein
MTKDEWEKFVKDELAWYAERVGGSDMPEAKLFCRRRVDTDGTTKAFTEKDPAVTIMAMPGLDDHGSVQAVREAAAEGDAFLVSVKLEVWAVEIPADADPAVVAVVKAAHAAGELDKLEPPLRKEKLHVYLESEDHPIRMFEAEIVRPAEGEASLTAWKENKLQLPRPGFKRYIAHEIRDGKKTLVARYLQ